MHWKKGELFVEIESAFSVNVNEDVWVVKKAQNLNDFPLELFRLQIRKSDHEGFAKWKRAISNWATDNGYELKR